MILLNTIYVLSSLYQTSSPPLHSLSPPLSLAYPPPRQDLLSDWYPPLYAPRSGPEPVFVLLTSPKYWVSRLAVPHMNYVMLYFETKASCNSGNDWTASVALSSIFPRGEDLVRVSTAVKRHHNYRNSWRKTSMTKISMKMLQGSYGRVSSFSL